MALIGMHYTHIYAIHVVEICYGCKHLAVHARWNIYVNNLKGGMTSLLGTVATEMDFYI